MIVIGVIVFFVRRRAAATDAGDARRGGAARAAGPGGREPEDGLAPKKTRLSLDKLGPWPVPISQQPSSAGPARASAGGSIWNDVSLRIEPGEFVGLLGENGSGKSTLLRVLLGAVALEHGSATVLGRPPGEANREIGYLPQRPSFGAGIALRGVDLVRLGLDGDRWGLPLPLLPGAARRRREARARVAEAVEMVGAGAYAERPLSELSGGEQQRLLIAQALVGRPALLLLDEPLDSLDLPNQAAVAALVDRICRRAGVAVVLVAHDVNPLLGIPRPRRLPRRRPRGRRTGRGGDHDRDAERALRRARRGAARIRRAPGGDRPARAAGPPPRPPRRSRRQCRLKPRRRAGTRCATCR